MRILRAVAIVGLAIDAYVHLTLAGDYGALDGYAVTQQTLFVVEGVLAIVAIVLLAVLRRSNLATLSALLIAGGGFVAVMTTRYVNIGAFGPFPPMYEPAWYTAKMVSAVAEGVATLALAIMLVLGQRGRGAISSKESSSV